MGFFQEPSRRRARAKGLLVSREEAERVAARDGGIVRDGLLALPAEIAPALADAAARGGAAEVERALDEAVRRLLSGWARTWTSMRVPDA